MISGLKEFLDLLDKRNELVRVSKEVESRFEASGVISRIQESINKAVLFEKVEGFGLPVVSNVLGSYQRIAMLLGSRLGKLNGTWNRRGNELELFAPVRCEVEGADYVECGIHDILSLTPVCLILTCHDPMP